MPVRSSLGGGLKVPLNTAGIIALAGNPNVGKSTVFNKLTGLNQHTGNWPGKTVGSAFGTYKNGGSNYVLIDLPGTYSLSAASQEEEIARDFLLGGTADACIIVCDATCLERNLYLTLQTLRVTKNCVLCLNLIDEAEKKGINIRVSALEKRLGIPVIKTSARSGDGLNKLCDIVSAIVSGNQATNPIQLDSDDDIIKIAEDICAEAIGKTDFSHNRDRKIDRILTGRFTGVPVMLFLLALVFWMTISGANAPSSMLMKLLLSVETPLHKFLTFLHAPVWFIEGLVFGVYRVTAWVVSVMLPPMAIFFPIFTFLEDFGYLPRVAFNLDHHFKKARSCGKQALSMCMGFGCNAAGVVGCRIIDSPRERLIAVITNSFVPCNGRFPMLIVVSTMFFSASGIGGSLLTAVICAAFVVFSIFLTFAVSRFLSSTFLKGQPSSFTLELPPYRAPQIGRVIVRSLLDRTLLILLRAVRVAAPAGLIIWILANIHIDGNGLLQICAGYLDPFAMAFGLDGVILLAFILGLPANEIVMPIAVMMYMSAGTVMELDSLPALHSLLTANGWTKTTAICVMLFSLTHWPCSTTCQTIKKETGSLKWTVISFLLPTLTGFFTCFLFTSASRLFHLF